MDYDILNGAIKEIYQIVNHFNKKRGYDTTLCEKMVLALVGYYITFGPDIFKKFAVLLDALEVYQCKTSEELIKLKTEKSSTKNNQSADPGLLWKHYYHPSTRKFIGAVPIIFFSIINKTTDVFSLIHELSHGLEGESAEIIEETDSTLKIKRGMGFCIVDKNTDLRKNEDSALTELITITIENRIFKEYIKLDPTQIQSPLVRDFVGQIKAYQKQNTLLNSYDLLASIFKDLIDNDIFFEIIKNNYYDNKQEQMVEQINSLDKQLDLRKLGRYAEMLVDPNVYDMTYYLPLIQKQLSILNERTSANTDKKLIIVV